MADSSASAAGLLISVGGLTQSGGAGAYDIVLTNTESAGGPTYNVAGFTFELLAPAGSSLMLTAVEYPASGSIPPYIFEGTGQTTLDPAIPLSTDTFPASHLTGSDAEFIDLSIPVAPGDAFALGRISFSSAATVSIDEIQRLFVRSGTSLSDENFQSIPYMFPAAAVPEPSALISTGLGLAALGIAGLRRRRQVRLAS